MTRVTALKIVYIGPLGRKPQRILFVWPWGHGCNNHPTSPPLPLGSLLRHALQGSWRTTHGEKGGHDTHHHPDHPDPAGPTWWNNGCQLATPSQVWLLRVTLLPSHLSSLHS
ncbi:hypothetical protein Mp_8g16890 [Marchantia polymorpha subsp. ruderalis]|uniref:Uncharacterized protein n=1 Tax=Marchantia polymorpha TaxID=3197 RepID=A0A2R6X841_MARPO|nr:hypothetical protein MARPO_0030s0022 [Marchantia polymorpha]BBN20160.1 hypothetical protein Mp_8g16890 [Marchantia polymorpha subsp. ruderalis]|eukprot:PTQ42274.1 hypothetical protein MARPO_0030s0022 [Marchantia polymorpha]